MARSIARSVVMAWGSEARNTSITLEHGTHKACTPSADLSTSASGIWMKIVGPMRA